MAALLAEAAMRRDAASAPARSSGRRLAFANMVVVGLQLAVGLGLMVVNLIVLLATGATPNMADGPGVSTVEQWNGLMPIPVPWWVFLAMALPSVVLMVLVWPVARHHREAAGRVVVRATPLWFALFAAIAAVITLSASLYYIDLDEWPGLYAVPAVLLALVAAIGIVRGVTTRPTSPRSQRVR